MFDNGTVMNGKLIESPNGFQVACTITTQIIAAVASNQYGGQSVDMKHLGKYLRKSYDKFKAEITEKYRGKIIKSENNRLTYTNNMEMITKITGDKKSSNFTGKEDEDENEIKKDGSKISIRDSFSSVYSINSILRKTIKDKQQKNEE